jgi:4'-phosphopantetheinyl transferase
MISEVHVWALRLTAAEPAIQAYRSLLSIEEKARADRFVFARHREAYTLSQGGLRLLLAGYLGLPAAEIELTAGPNGKPSLRTEAPLGFNKSHSGQLALYAFSSDCDIGVDVEELREISHIDQIASLYFCRGEAAELSSLESQSARQEAFYRCWTRKEAYIKAVGDGLHMPLNQFQVTLLPGHPARFVHVDGDEQLRLQWNLRHLEPAPGYIGALAYRGVQRSVMLHEPLSCDDLLEAG